jgi:hypothetical protein
MPHALQNTPLWLSSQYWNSVFFVTPSSPSHAAFKPPQSPDSPYCSCHESLPSLHHQRSRKASCHHQLHHKKNRNSLCSLCHRHLNLRLFSCVSRLNPRSSTASDHSSRALTSPAPVSPLRSADWMKKLASAAAECAMCCPHPPLPTFKNSNPKPLAFSKTYAGP